MRVGSTIADAPVPVTLQDQQMLDRGKQLAEKIGVRTGLVDAKKAENKKRQDEIDEFDEEISRLARVIVDGFENRDQMDLFADQKLAKDKAAAALIEVAKRAARHPFVGEAGTGCTREDCGRLADDEAHRQPDPSKPHTFVPDGSGEGKCWACPAPKDDAVHAEPAPPVVETFVCSDCDASGASLEASTHSKAEGQWIDSKGALLCANCRQVRIENGTWPHAFEPDPAVRKKRGKAPLCKHCTLGADEAVHAEGTVEPTPQEAQDVAEKAAATGDPAYDFTGEEPAPADGADDGAVGGKSGEAGA
jgi:hypothetical protein